MKDRVLAIIRLKCPKCRQTNLFEHSMIELTRLSKMPDVCSVCKQKFDLEPGFYWGAMYIAYMLSAIFCFISIPFLYKVIHFSLLQAIVFSLIIGLLASPYTFRVSRAVYLSIFVAYDASFERK